MLENPRYSTDKPRVTFSYSRWLEILKTNRPAFAISHWLNEMSFKYLWSDFEG